MNKTKVLLARLCLLLLFAAVAPATAATLKVDSQKWMNIQTASCLLQARVSSRVRGQLRLEIRSVKSRCKFESNIKALETDQIMGFPLTGSMSVQDSSGEKISIRFESNGGWWCPAVLSSNVTFEKNTLQTTVLEKSQILTLDFGYAAVLREARKLTVSRGGESIAKIKMRIPVEIKTSEKDNIHVDLDTDWIDIGVPR